jgi:hypothetical protein
VKSYFLDSVADAARARQVLSELLPTQSNPWVLQTTNGLDVIAYLNVLAGNECDCEGPYVIQADISGRHFNDDQSVISLLLSLRESLGGVILNDDERI